MATGAIRVMGTDAVLIKLNEEMKKIKFKTKSGLIRAGLFVQGEAQRRTPRDLGNLINSAFTVWDGGSKSNPRFKNGVNRSPVSSRMTSEHTRTIKEEGAQVKYRANPMVEVGYSAFYAVYVHEDLEAKHTVGVAKFLQTAIHANFLKILKYIKEEIGYR